MQIAHTLMHSLPFHKHLLSSCCMPHTVLDMGPHAGPAAVLGALTHCSEPQMTTCPDATCYSWGGYHPLGLSRTLGLTLLRRSSPDGLSGPVASQPFITQEELLYPASIRQQGR
ncbi:unnamed protein product [Rangifer tarandus platyrhynchus]|uniref:Uncharacterized protein n=1 Tax=Rangifer tarandus platyrhynchus TaxID=3082113 RepID=A0ABN8ZI61_RANTA|nr:unnamed protein product [Rangifer tarandus platyrhynchus]